MARVLLFTDEPILAKGFIAVVSSVPGFDTVSVCHTTAELAETVPTLKPDVLLIDLTPEVTFGILTQLHQSGHQRQGSRLAWRGKDAEAL